MFIEKKEGRKVYGHHKMRNTSTCRYAQRHERSIMIWKVKTLHNDTKEKFINWDELELRAKKVIELVEGQVTEQEPRVKKAIELVIEQATG